MKTNQFSRLRRVICVASALSAGMALSSIAADAPAAAKPEPPPPMFRPAAGPLSPGPFFTNTQAGSSGTATASVASAVSPALPPPPAATTTNAVPSPATPAGAAAVTNAPAAGRAELPPALPAGGAADNAVIVSPKPAAEIPAGQRTLRFQDAPIDLVLQEYANLTGRTMIKSPGINAVITIRSQTPLSEAEAKQAIEAALSLNNVTLVPLGEKFFKVVQPGSARQEGLPFETANGDAANLPEGDGLTSMVVTLKHLTTDEISPVLQGLLHGYGKIQTLERTNSLLITDTRSNLKRTMEILDYLDKPASSKIETRVYELRCAKAADIAQQFNELIADAQSQQSVQRNRASAAGATSTPAGVIRPPASATRSAGVDSALQEKGMISGRVKVISDERTNTMIVISEPSNFSFFDELVAVLDRRVEPEISVKVYPMEYADAEEAAQILNEFIGSSTTRRTGTGTSTTGSRTSTTPMGTRNATASTTAADARSQSLRDFIDRLDTAAPSTAAGAAGKVGIGQISPDTRILADKRSNALLIMGRRDDVAALLDITRQIDVMLAQVVIEAVIVEVTLSDSLSFGFDWLQRSFQAYQTANAGPGGGLNVRTPVASWGGGFVGGTAATFKDASAVGRDTALPAGALSYFLTLDNFNLDAILHLAASSADAKVLSTPVIMTTDNTEANIIAGEERPVVGATTVTDGGNQTSSYEYRNIGIELTVKPRINPQGVVVMEVKQTVDNVGDTVTIDGNDVPVITKREMKGILTISNRTTVVLGGLVSNSDRKTMTKVPLLGDIPLIGRLFRSQSTEKVRTELLVFMTPYVMSTPEEARKETRRIHDATSIRGTEWQKLWSDGDLGQNIRKEDEEAIKLRHKSRIKPSPLPAS